jgi:hypothetical protein
MLWLKAAWVLFDACCLLAYLRVRLVWVAFLDAVVKGIEDGVL